MRARTVAGVSHETIAKRLGRPPLTDRHALLAAARDIGFEGLTVGAVTAAVGVKYSTFYRHFPTLDAMVGSLVDLVFEKELQLSAPGGSWQDTVRDTCAELGQMLDRNPGMGAAVVALPELPIEVMAVYRRLTDALVGAGIPAHKAAMGAIYALETVTVADLTTPGLGHSLQDRQRQVDAIDPPVDPGVREATARMIDQPGSAWTIYKIDLLIAGLEAQLASS
ncbi:TetR family transcriptional regulator [Pseudonocardia endophytica]|uniref:TetR family transcriptional regulator n=1 Tax=Pseudonocardia endophytica TaxID=401976 RepID=A0A4R1I0X7_PSEEN|nr:TetR family transcriptional regulator [Pseudonocardia endophytica]